MSPLRPAALSALALIAATSCGGAPPPPPAAPPPPPAPAPPPAPKPDLSEVAEPADLFGLIRWKSPEATLESIKAWVPLPLGAKELVSEALGDRKLADLIDVGSPVDFAAALDPSGSDQDLVPLAAVAIGVRSLEDARAAAEAKVGAVEIHPGVYRLGPVKRPRKSHSKAFCVLAASVGSAPARVICGEREHDVEVLAPYLTRTLPKQSISAADLHAELRFMPLEKRYGALLRRSLGVGASVVPAQIDIGQPEFDRAVGDAVHAIVTEVLALSEDLDQMNIEATAEPNGIEATAAFRMRGTTSWTAHTMMGTAERASSPPAMFWRLPADSTSASYRRSPDSKQFTGIRRTLSELLDGWLAHDGLGPRDRAALTELFDPKYASDATVVTASGPLGTAERSALLTGAPNEPAEVATARETVASFGWHVIGLDDAPKRWSEYVKSAIGAYNRGAVQTYLKKRLVAGSIVDAVPTAKIVPPAKGLPAGSIEVELAAPAGVFTHEAGDAQAKPKSKPPAVPPVRVYFVLMPDQDRTWFGMGGDPTTLAAHLAVVKTGASDAGTITSRAGLDALHQGSFVSAGFTTLEGIATAIPLARAMSDSAVPDLDRLLNSIPHHGETPVVFTSTITSGNALSWSSAVRAPKGTIEDAVALALGVATHSSSASPPPQTPIAPSPPTGGKPSSGQAKHKR
jgi:hypothetical protein